MFAIVSYISCDLLLLQVACDRFDRKAVLLKWDAGFITLGFGVLAHDSTREKTIARAIEENMTADDASKCLKIQGCSPRAVDEHEGRGNVMEVSFAPALSIPACFFAFETAEIRDEFMKGLQAQATSGTSGETAAPSQSSSDIGSSATPRSPMRHVAVAVAVAATLLCAVALFRRRHR